MKTAVLSTASSGRWLGPGCPPWCRIAELHSVGALEVSTRRRQSVRQVRWRVTSSSANQHHPHPLDGCLLIGHRIGRGWGKKRGLLEVGPRMGRGEGLLQALWELCAIRLVSFAVSTVTLSLECEAHEVSDYQI